MDTNSKLIIFDLDGTLADRDSDTLYPHAEQWLKEHDNWMVATNQGGVGLRYWMERDGFGTPEQYPSQADVEIRLQRLFPMLTPERLVNSVLVCFCYQSKKSGKWSPVPPEKVSPYITLGEWWQEWRKPAPGMLLYAMRLRDVTPADTLMVGDDVEDMQAASAAGCTFMYPHEFFGTGV